jgi:hypothetical protein
MVSHLVRYDLQLMGMENQILLQFNGYLLAVVEAAALVTAQVLVAVQAVLYKVV